MNWLSRIFPGLALKRKHNQLALIQAERAYEAAQSSQYRKRPPTEQSGDGALNRAGVNLRTWARHLDENHDLAIGILDVLVNNIVGGNGLTVEPMVMQKNGRQPLKTINKKLRQAWQVWIKRPEVTRELPFSEVQRLVCRAWLRDGEELTKHILGTKATIDHGQPVPYSIECLEADYLPFDYVDTNKRIIHGVEKNAWNQPVKYHLYKEHPGNVPAGLILPSDSNTRPINAEEIIHLKFCRRLGQTRGVTIFHGIITRLDDIKDYEESERIAARVAAAFTAVIQKNGDFQTPVNNTNGNRTFEMNPGMVFDNLLPGETVETIDSNRPNTNLGTFRNDMLRACASGTGASYSSISKDYDGSYSSQRQELVEAGPNYARLRGFFIEKWLRPIYEQFVDMAVDAGVIDLPANFTREELKAANFGGVAMPWIDPLKEVKADGEAVDRGFKSRQQVIMERGYDFQQVNDQLNADTFTKKQTPIKTETKPAASDNDATDDDSEAAA